MVEGHGRSRRTSIVFRLRGCPSTTSWSPSPFRGGFGEIYHHIVAALAMPAGAGPQARDTLRGQPFLSDDLLEHRVGIGFQRPRRLADHIILQDRGVIAVQLPSTEERGPVDILAQIRQIPVGKGMYARLRWRRGLVRQEGVVEIGARLFERQQRALALARARIADLDVFGGGILHDPIALGVRQQAAGDADRAAGVEHMDHRAIIGRVDPQRGVDLAGGRAADQQRHGEPRARHLFRHGHHLVERGGDEAREPDHVGLVVVGAFEDGRSTAP